VARRELWDYERLTWLEQALLGEIVDAQYLLPIDL
jgi:hypothetical protein